MIKNNGCCDLEYAKKLKESGVKQESLWYWNIDTAYKKPRIIPAPKGDWAEFNITKHCISAFTVAELGEMLPNYYMSMNSGKNSWVCEDFDTYEHPAYKFTPQNTEANVRAKMLIWLIEQGKVKP